MEFKYITNLQPGDIFKFRGGKPTEVKDVEHNVCGAGKVHINNADCFDSLSVVEVRKKEEVTA